MTSRGTASRRVPLGRLERPHMAPEATALSTELQGQMTSLEYHNYPD
jgi:hypothetical protein